LDMCALLLQAGCDPRLRAGEESAQSIAKDDAVKQCIKEWDVSVTDRLIDERKKAMRQKMESRILTAVEREALAKIAINKGTCGSDVLGGRMTCTTLSGVST